MPSTLCLSLALACFAGDGPQEGDLGPPRVLVAAPADARHAHLSWPKLVRAGDGTLVMAYCAGRFHGNGGEGCPAVSISKDQGKTFTAPKILRNFDRETPNDACGNLAIGMAGDGAVVLMGMAFRGTERNTVFGWRSADSGQNWSEVDTTTLDENRTGSVFGNVFSVPGRGLAVTGHYRKGSKPHETGIWLAYSKDEGRTWGQPERILDQHLVEPAILYTDQRFLGLIRNGRDASYYWQREGDAKGEKWQLAKSSIASEGADDYRFPSPFLTVDPKNPRKLYALESNRHKKGNLPGRISLWTAELPDLAWKRLATAVRWTEEAKSHRDFSYPWMVPLEDGKWLMTFYSGNMKGANALYGVTFSMPGP